MKVLLVVLFSVFFVPLECYRLPPKKLSGNREKLNQLKHFIHAQKFQHSKAQSVQSLLKIVNGLFYTANITIGTPPQQFLVFIDPDSSDLIVPDTSVNNFTGVTNTNVTFNSSASSTYQLVGNATDPYGNTLLIGQDTVKLGGIGTPQITIPKTRFLLDLTDVLLEFYELGINGILGIAFESLSMSGEAPPLINAINQGLLSQPILTTYLNGDENDFETGAGGNIVYGGVNTQNCGSSITYQPLSSASRFQITLSGISVGNYSISKSYQAVVDFDESIVGPQNVLDAIAKQVGATPKTGLDGDTYYSIDCNATIPSLNLKIGSNTYSIDGKNLILNLFGFNDLCGLRLHPMDNGGFGASWVLGLPLTQQYCTVFDLGNKRIGFTPAKNQ